MVGALRRLLPVADHLGEGEGGGDQVQHGDPQERPHPGVGVQLEDADGGGGHGDREGGDGLAVEGGRVLLLARCVTHGDKRRPTWPGPHPSGYSARLLRSRGVQRPQNAETPVSARPMRSFWIWLVPSYRVITRASRSSLPAG